MAMAHVSYMGRLTTAINGVFSIETKEILVSWKILLRSAILCEAIAGFYVALLLIIRKRTTKEA